MPIFQVYVNARKPWEQAPTVPKKILARCGMLRHAAACFRLLVKGTIIFQKRHRFQKPDQNTVNHMP